MATFADGPDFQPTLASTLRTPADAPAVGLAAGTIVTTGVRPQASGVMSRTPGLIFNVPAAGTFYSLPKGTKVIEDSQIAEVFWEGPETDKSGGKVQHYAKTVDKVVLADLLTAKKFNLDYGDSINILVDTNNNITRATHTTTLK